MKGRVLGYDAGTGFGQISGDDGQRYNFSRFDLKRGATVSAGVEVDFEDIGRHAKDVYVLSVASWQTAYARHAGPDLGLFGYFLRAITTDYFNFSGRARRIGAFMTIGYIVLGCLDPQPRTNRYGPPQI